MICIGIFAPNNSNDIIKTLFSILKANDKVVAIKEDHDYIDASVNIFKNCGIDYCIITFNRFNTFYKKVDILVIDDPSNNSSAFDPMKCINEHTIIIYNTESSYCPPLNHNNSIDYGMSSSSTVSVSSVNYMIDSNISFLISIQKNILGIFDNIVSIGEIMIDIKSKVSVLNQLPAIICALVCGIDDLIRVKI